ncbi:hypothetical protein P691DRAFT_802326 [Macrolepiota fuliginosa MF-IS2]|uniref:Uncharacterized protein n=1 Tax=Macrolepiota fuliginosa MF-IS2 TaxID=1400762 RepID=A0A9P5XAJ3_9AGAR|nr:hypothetical protein P691DRAFT_802326 [Macrolepiota fuliginosa MF-IS2]
MDIPQEILHAFIKLSQDDPQTLLSLCLVSWRCVDEAQKMLYKTIVITDESDSSSTQVPDVVKISTKLFKTLTQYNPPLAKCVKKFVYHPDFPFRDQEYRDLTNKSLRLMTNLESLTIYTPFPPGLFRGCTFRLNEFLFCCVSSGYPYPDREDMCRFLSRQSHLKTLYINMVDDACITLDRRINLETLCGNRLAIETILPGRSTVKYLEWITGREDDLTSPPRLISNELSNIRALTLGGDKPRPLLALLASHMRSLRVLRLIGKPRTNSSDEADNEFECLPDLVNLRIFVWSARSLGKANCEYEQGMVNRERQRELVTKWFRNMGILEAAYFQIAPVKDEPRNYLCWRRNEIDPVPVGFYEAVSRYTLMPWFWE